MKSPLLHLWTLWLRAEEGVGPSVQKSTQKRMLHLTLERWPTLQPFPNPCKSKLWSYIRLSIIRGPCCCPLWKAPFVAPVVLHKCIANHFCFVHHFWIVPSWCGLANPHGMSTKQSCQAMHVVYSGLEPVMYGNKALVSLEPFPLLDKSHPLPVPRSHSIKSSDMFPLVSCLWQNFSTVHYYGGAVFFHFLWVHYYIYNQRFVFDYALGYS